MNIGTAIARFSSVDKRFCSTLAVLVEKWAPGKPPVTLVLSAFGKVLAEALKLNDAELLTIGLELVEKCLKDEQMVRVAVATGLLESLLAESSAGRLDFVLIAPYLGEQSKAYCREWDRFTGVVTPGLN